MVGVKPLPGWTDVMVMLVLRERGCSIRQNRISSKSEFITSVAWRFSMISVVSHPLLGLLQLGFIVFYFY